MGALWLPPQPAIIRPAEVAPVQRPRRAMFTFPLGLYASSAAAISISNQGTQNLNSTTTTYTFTSASIGAADATRLVVLCISAFRTASPFAISSVTIGGNAASLIVGNGGTTGFAQSQRQAIYALAVAAGTNATIVVTTSATGTQVTVQVLAVYNLSSTTAFSTGGAFSASNVSSLSTTLNVPAGGIQIVSAQSGASSNDHTATNFTEQWDAANSGAMRAHGGYDSGMSAQTGRSVTSASANVASRTIVAASWS